MSIQQSINQTLGIAGVLATQTPAYKAQVEKKAEEAALKQEEKKVEAQLNVLDTVIEGMAEGKEYSKSAIRQAKVDLQSAQKRMAEIRPTKENIEMYLGTTSNIERWDKKQAQLERAAANAAAKRAAGKNLRQRAEEALNKSEEEKTARTETKSRIITNINKWGELNGR